MADADRGFLTAGLPVAPSLTPVLRAVHIPPPHGVVDRRVLGVSVLAVLLALVAACVAQLLTLLIGLVTNVAFFGRISSDFVSPAENRLGWIAVVVPVLGGLIVGLMARFGSKAIRGHGIPEAMEQVLTNESRIPMRMAFLKPLSAAISIGTGGPFGAEGPIIATGGALGSLLGQVLKTSAVERKTLLAAGAAAGMSATFGSPVSAVLLAVELLLFEYKPRSLVPVAFAAATAAAVRVAFVGGAAAFAMPELSRPSGAAQLAYALLGAVVGAASVWVTRAVYAVEDRFERLPIHWMWWPALGGLAVGLVGLVAPRTMGVGYDNIEHILAGDWGISAILTLCGWKFVSWAIALGSGTSGGTLAPLFTLGGGLGAVLGALVAAWAPSIGIDVRIAALVGMAAMFAGASRALLASLVFAFETTHQPLGILPLLSGCSVSYLVSCMWMRTTIMTEKISRRGVPVSGEYELDFLAHTNVSAVATRAVATFAEACSIAEARAWLASGVQGTGHQGFPVLNGAREVRGLVMRAALMSALDESAALASLLTRPAVVVYEDSSLRDAADLMARQGIGRLPVVSRDAPHVLVGMVTRSDLVNSHTRRLDEQEPRRAALNF